MNPAYLAILDYWVPSSMAPHPDMTNSNKNNTFISSKCLSRSRPSNSALFRLDKIEIMEYFQKEKLKDKYQEERPKRLPVSR